MNGPLPLTPLQPGDFELVVQTLIARGGEAVQVQQLSRDQSALLQKRALGPVRIAVVRYNGAAPSETENALRAEIKAATGVPLDLVLVGGSDAAKRLLKKVKPFYSLARIGLLHLADDRRSWSQSVTVAGGHLLPFDTCSAGVRSDATTWSELLERTAQSREESAALNAELHAFATLVKKRRPVATWSIAAVIALVFGLEQLLGGPESSPVLVRLGALVPARLAAGEWWRLVSCTFLHADWLHAVLNIYVLLVLGEFLERIIGPARFLVLYTVSAVLGSLRSAFLLKAVMSIGASGAVWGLLGAHAILAYRSQGLLPAALIPGAKRAAKINLLINVLNSFRPYVDMWAHFAGGLAGALLFLSGVLTRKLPKLGEAGGSTAGDAGTKLPTSRALWTAAAIAGSVLLSGPLSALVRSQPLALTEPVSLTRSPLTEFGVSVDLPAGLSPKTVETPNGPELSFGDALSDPMMVNVFAVPLPPLDEEGLAAEIEGLKKRLELPGSSDLLAAPAVFRRGVEPGLTVSYAYASGLIYERAFLFMKGKLVRVDVLRWPAHPRSAPVGAARAIAESAMPLGT